MSISAVGTGQQISNKIGDQSYFRRSSIGLWKECYSCDERQNERSSLFKFQVKLLQDSFDEDYSVRQQGLQ